MEGGKEETRRWEGEGGNKGRGGRGGEGEGGREGMRE